MADNNNVSNENLHVLPTENVITDIKFGNNIYEIGLGEETREAIEGVFSDINDNFTTLNTAIEDNEEVVSNALNDLEERKAEKSELPVIPTNVSAFTNDVPYLTQHQDLSAYFNDVAYDSSTKHINFKNGNTINAYIDATAFIKDGMVDNVEIDDVTIGGVSTPCLVITFNTDAGKEDINIPLSSIFDSEQYYTKDEIDNVEKVISNALIDLDKNKLDASVIDNYYTKTESDAKYLTAHQDISDYFNDAEYDAAQARINFKNGNTVKKYIDTTQIFNPESYYSKAEIDEADKAVANALNDLDSRKADIADLPTNVSSFTNDEGYFNDAEYDSSTSRINFKYGNTVKKYIDTTDIFDPDDYYTKDVIDDGDKVIASSLSDLDSRKADKTELPTKVSDITNDAGYFNDVEYDSANTRINFKFGNTVKKYIDATAFIKDGMVDNVEIDDVTIEGVSTPCLVITFNTDSGKQAINIPLTSFFDADDYYTKDEVDNTELAIANALTDLDGRKLDYDSLDNYYTKAQCDGKYLTTHQDLSSYFNDVTYDSSSKLISFKNNQGYTVKTIDITQIFDADDYYTKDEIDEADNVVASALNVLETNKADVSDLATVAFSGSYNHLSERPTITNTITQNSSDLVTSGAVYNVVEQNERVIASSLADLDSRKADKTDIPTNISSFTNDAGYLTAHQDISGKADKMLLVNHGTSDTTFELTPNTKHVWGEVSSLTITLGTEITGIVNVFYFQFDSGSTATTLSLPASVKWNYDEQLVVLPNTRYQISIEGGIATVGFASLT